MKQEKLNNPGEGETPDQEDVTAALRKMAEGLENGGKKISRRGFLKGALRVAAGIAVGSSALEALGKEGEKTEDDKEKETKKKNVGFLRGVFQKISGGGIAKDEKSGNLIIHMGGGKYNALENKELDKITDSMTARRENIEKLQEKLKSAKKPEEIRVCQKLIDAANLLANGAVRSEITKANHSVRAENLPQSLKDFERAREEAVKGMEGSIIQPINPSSQPKK